MPDPIASPDAARLTEAELDAIGAGYDIRQEEGQFKVYDGDTLVYVGSTYVDVVGWILHGERG